MLPPCGVMLTTKPQPNITHVVTALKNSSLYLLMVVYLHITWPCCVGTLGEELSGKYMNISQAKQANQVNL